ncbi:MAG: beta-ketoacyl-ACP synthase 3 [Clostridiales bacterium]|nr:beta-ketoacyl-ACP synthase 3 [Clostridiales bacterium]
MGIKILKTSSYVPGEPIDNSYYVSYLDTSDEWIRQRTGIETRYISKDEGTETMSVKAAEKLELTDEEKARIKVVLVATTTSTSTVPINACILQGALGLSEDIYACDIGMACAGFVAALRMADALLKEGELALVVGVEVLSKMSDKTDRSTVILFGDGAGAVLIEKNDKESYFEGGSRYSEVLASKLLPMTGDVEYLTMDGAAVFRFALEVMNASMNNLLERSGNSYDEIDWYILHQANKRILEGTARKFGVSPDRFPMNMNKYGNTSSASIPLLLDELNRAGKLKRGQKMIMAGFGGGLTWQAVYLEW